MDVEFTSRCLFCGKRNNEYAASRLYIESTRRYGSDRAFWALCGRCLCEIFKQSGEALYEEVEMIEFEKWEGENCDVYFYEPRIALEEAYLAGQKSGLLKAVDIGEKRKLAVKPYFETMAAIHKAAKEVER